jgi:hypothetical protein
MAARKEHPDLQFWRQRVQAWYPDYLKRPYFQPAVFMNRTQHQAAQFAGQNIFVYQPAVSTMPRLPFGAPKPAVPILLESNVRDDTVQGKVLRCLQNIPGFDTEVMFIISQLDFGSYLNQPAYAAAARSLPRPVDLKSQKKHRGDFDLLIIHHDFGIFVAEMKAIGDKVSSMTPQQLEQKIADRIRQAIGQLHKDNDVLKYIVSHHSPPPRIFNILMLPNVSTAQLQSILSSDPQLSIVGF